MARNKFFSDFYDSVHQRTYPNRIAADNNYKNLYAGRLRLDTLLSESLVIVDTQLLDGEFFLDHGPSSLSNLIARKDREPMPLIIKSRLPKLEDALLRFYKKPNEDNLQGFAPSVIRNDELRINITQSLQKTKADKIRTCWDILPIFLDAGVAQDEVERIKTGWTHWIEAQGHNLFIVEQWKGTWDLDSALDKNWLNRCVTSQEGCALVETIWNFRLYRSDNEKKILTFRQEAQSEATLGEADQIEIWFNRAYNLTIANQHECDAFESIHTLSSSRSGCSVDMESPEVTLDLPEHFLRSLGSMSTEDFHKHFTKNHCDPNYFEQWWKEGKEDDLRRAIEPLAAAAVIDSRGKEENNLRKFIGPFTVEEAGRAIGGHLGGVASPYVGIDTNTGKMVGEFLGGLSGKISFNRVDNFILHRPAQKIVQRVAQIAKERKT